MDRSIKAHDDFHARASGAHRSLRLYHLVWLGVLVGTAAGGFVAGFEAAGVMVLLGMLTESLLLATLIVRDRILKARLRKLITDIDSFRFSKAQEPQPPHDKETRS